MCLILFSLGSHSRYELVIAANRDEYFHRATAPAAFGDEWPDLLAGKDLVHGGTWLGITRTGRFAVVSNYRSPERTVDAVRSRGELPLEFLLGSADPADFLAWLHESGEQFDGFNMLFGFPRRLYYYSNRGTVPPLVSPGLHGLSNGLLDTPWPKVATGTTRLARIMGREEGTDPEQLFRLLADSTPFPDEALPRTGVSLQWERTLSPLFITGPEYGTRSSTVLLVDGAGEVQFLERSYTPSAQPAGTATFRFTIEGSLDGG